MGWEKTSQLRLEPEVVITMGCLGHCFKGSTTSLHSAVSRGPSIEIFESVATSHSRYTSTESPRVLSRANPASVVPKL